MWLYEQDTGRFYDNQGYLVGTGYSGAGEDKNDPADESIPQKGPLPSGLYTILLPITHPHLGPLAMQLVPDARNKMYGRSDFWIHGDSLSHPGQASKGCIVQGHDVRQLIADGLSSDSLLAVVEDFLGK